LVQAPAEARRKLRRRLGSHARGDATVNGLEQALLVVERGAARRANRQMRGKLGFVPWLRLAERGSA